MGESMYMIEIEVDITAPSTKDHYYVVEYEQNHMVKAPSNMNDEQLRDYLLFKTDFISQVEESASATLPDWSELVADEDTLEVKIVKEIKEE